MKKLKVDDNYFNGSKKQDIDDKTGGKSSKKGKKQKKLEDFLDYANKNGIQVNIEYEDKSIKSQEKYADNKGSKGKFTNTNEKPKTSEENSKKPVYENKGYKKPINKNFHYKKGFQNKMRDLHKMGNNKFDLCNPTMPRNMNMAQPMFNGFYGGMGMVPPMKQFVSNTEEDYKLLDDSDKSIVDFLSFYLSLDNLNKDLYLRNRVNEDGWIHLEEIASHKKLANRGVDYERLRDILSECEENTIVQMTADDNGHIYIRNRDWETIKSELISVSEIYQQKKQKKAAMFNAMNSMNYVGMQNNYFFNGIPANPEDMQMKMMTGNYPHMMMGYQGYQQGGYQYPMMGMNNHVPNNYTNSENQEEEQN